MDGKKEHGVQINSVIRALNILDILKRETDQTHRLNKKRLKEIAVNEGVICTEKTLRRDIATLVEALNPTEDEYWERPEDFKIIYDGIGEDRYHKTGIAYIHEFSNEDLVLLIELLKGSDEIGEEHAERLISNLKALGSKYYTYNVDAILKPPKYSTIDNTNIQCNLQVIDSAIKKNVRIQFTFNCYNRDGDLVPVREREYVVNPYHVIIYGQKYYLLATHGNYKDVHIYRLDLMTDVVLVDESRASIRGVSELQTSVKEYMEGHIGGVYDKPCTIQLKVNHPLGYNAVRDQFGSNYTIKEQGDEFDIIEVNASPSSVVNWIFPYLERIEILRPNSLKEMIKEKAYFILKQYP